MDPPRTGDGIVRSTNLEERATKVEVLRNHRVVGSSPAAGANVMIPGDMVRVAKRHEKEILRPIVLREFTWAFDENDKVSLNFPKTVLFGIESFGIVLAIAPNGTSPISWVKVLCPCGAGWCLSHRLIIVK